MMLLSSCSTNSESIIGFSARDMGDSKHLMGIGDFERGNRLIKVESNDDYGNPELVDKNGEIQGHLVEKTTVTSDEKISGFYYFAFYDDGDNQRLSNIDSLQSGDKRIKISPLPSKPIKSINGTWKGQDDFGATVFLYINGDLARLGIINNENPSKTEIDKLPEFRCRSTSNYFCLTNPKENKPLSTCYPVFRELIPDLSKPDDIIMAWCCSINISSDTLSLRYYCTIHSRQERVTLEHF